MNKYKAGDKVKIRSDLEVGKMYGFDYFMDYMQDYKGKILTVSKILDCKYKVLENSDNWTDEMIEGKVEDMEKKIYKGWEILKEIAEGNIKEKTEFIVKDADNNELGRYEFINAEFIDKNENILFEEWTIELLAKSTFEIVEEKEEEPEEQKEINIHDMEEIPQVGIDNCTDRNYAYVGDKINEIIRYLKQKDKEE